MIPNNIIHMLLVDFLINTAPTDRVITPSMQFALGAATVVLIVLNVATASVEIRGLDKCSEHLTPDSFQTWWGTKALVILACSRQLLTVCFFVQSQGVGCGVLCFGAVTAEAKNPSAGA